MLLFPNWKTGDIVILLLGGFSGIGGGPFSGTGYYGGGGLVIAILLILVPMENNQDDGADTQPPKSDRYSRQQCRGRS